MRHDNPTALLSESESVAPSAADSTARPSLTFDQQTSAPDGGRATLVGALFDGLSADDREWVVERINHYRALAAADQAPEGRL